jgi:hypothetical protein
VHRGAHHRRHQRQAATTFCHNRFNLPGAPVIVDDPTVVAALSDGGFAATEYLNSTLPMRLRARSMSQRSLPSKICALAAPPRLNERNRCGHGGRAILATGLLEKTAPYGTRWHKIVDYTQWGGPRLVMIGSVAMRVWELAYL